MTDVHNGDGGGGGTNNANSNADNMMKKKKAKVKTKKEEDPVQGGEMEKGSDSHVLYKETGHGQKEKQMHVNLEVFVNKELDVIRERAVGTTLEYTILRESCNHVQGIVRSYAEVQGERCGALPEEITAPLLLLLGSCLDTKNYKVVEPALACLHKLIAYAYLQGETRPSGRLDDSNNVVVSVVKMAAKAVTTAPNHTVQLAAVKTLLTSTTAEHFVPHGDCLMLAVRTAFNIAVNGSTKDVKNAAASALLQMLNTIFKRVAHQITVRRLFYQNNVSLLFSAAACSVVASCAHHAVDVFISFSPRIMCLQHVLCDPADLKCKLHIMMVKMVRYQKDQMRKKMKSNSKILDRWNLRSIK